MAKIAEPVRLDRKESILNSIQLFWEEKNYPPTIRDLIALTDITSTSVMRYYLLQLRDKGEICFDDKVNRSIRMANMRISFDKRPNPMDSRMGRMEIRAEIGDESLNEFIQEEQCLD